LLDMLGVGQAQGWLFGRALPADEVWREGRPAAQPTLAKS
jgi:sensor c-di-GMP phosphodiesterase-like protein